MAYASNPPMKAPAPPPRNREAALRALVWTLLESVGLSGLGFVALVVISRYVGPAEFGIASVALAVVQMALVIVERLFHDPLIQRTQLTPRDSATAFSATLLVGVVLSLACWLAAPWLARQIGQPALVAPLRWMTLTILAAGAGSVLIALHRRELAFRALALRSLLARTLAALTAITLAVWGAGVWSIVAQHLLMTALSAAALWWLSGVARPRLAWDGKALREMLALGVPSTLQAFASIANARLFILLAALQLSVAAVGQIALAFRAVDLVRDLLAQALSQLALPLFARLEREGGDRRTAFIAAVRLTSALLLPLFTGLALLSLEVVELAFGRQWLEAAPFVSLLALLTFHYFPRQFVTPLFGALGRPAAPLFGSLAQALFLASMLWALPQASPMWVMGVWAARLLVSTPIDMWLLRRLAGIGFVDQWRGAFTPALACAVMALGVTALRWLDLSALATAWRLLLLGAAGALVYVLALWLIDRPLLHEVKSAAVLALQRRRGRAPA